MRCTKYATHNPPYYLFAHSKPQACFSAVYGPPPGPGRSGLPRKSNLGVCGVCRRPMKVPDGDGGKSNSTFQFFTSISSPFRPSPLAPRPVAMPNPSRSSRSYSSSAPLGAFSQGGISHYTASYWLSLLPFMNLSFFIWAEPAFLARPLTPICLPTMHASTIYCHNF
jgi:hypothetical protein